MLFVFVVCCSVLFGVVLCVLSFSLFLLILICSFRWNKPRCFCFIGGLLLFVLVVGLCSLFWCVFGCRCLVCFCCVRSFLLLLNNSGVYVGLVLFVLVVCMLCLIVCVFCIWSCLFCVFAVFLSVAQKRGVFSLWWVGVVCVRCVRMLLMMCVYCIWGCVCFSCFCQAKGLFCSMIGWCWLRLLCAFCVFFFFVCGLLLWLLVLFCCCWYCLCLLNNRCVLNDGLVLFVFVVCMYLMFVCVCCCCCWCVLLFFIVVCWFVRVGFCLWSAGGVCVCCLFYVFDLFAVVVLLLLWLILCICLTRYCLWWVGVVCVCCCLM